MSWLEIYVPIGRLDAGLTFLLVVWLAAVACGFWVWLSARGRAAP